MHEEESSVDPHVARVHVPVRVRLQFSSISWWTNLNFPWNQKDFCDHQILLQSCSKSKDETYARLSKFRFADHRIPQLFRTCLGKIKWGRSHKRQDIESKFPYFLLEKVFFSISKQYVFSNGLLSIEMVCFSVKRPLNKTMRFQFFDQCQSNYFYIVEAKKKKES